MPKLTLKKYALNFFNNNKYNKNKNAKILG